MTNTLQCWCCGKALLVDNVDRDAEMICPACGKSAHDTALQSGESTPHASSAAVTKEEPLTPRALGAATAEEDPDIRKPADWSRVLIVLIAIASGALVIGMGYYWTGALGPSGRDIAVSQTRTIAKACQTYAERHGRLPDNLQALLQQKNDHGPFLESRDALLDPWGQSYQYDAKGPRNGGERPDIWTVDPADGTVIGNWPRSR